jgi:multidrug efflux pump subunit AcrB
MNTKFAMIALAVLFTLAGYEAASALNPQPLPPRHMPVMTVVHGPASGRLNPQPLPPG